MTQVVVLGHGGYAQGMKGNIAMLLGEIEGFHFLDFDISEDLETFKERLNETVLQIGKDPILFVCDLTGGSPFREACLITSEHNDYVVVGGINTAGFSEIAFLLEKSPDELSKLAIEASIEAIMVFKI